MTVPSLSASQHSSQQDGNHGSRIPGPAFGMHDRSLQLPGRYQLEELCAGNKGDTYAMLASCSCTTDVPLMPTPLGANRFTRFLWVLAMIRQSVAAAASIRLVTASRGILKDHENLLRNVDLAHVPHSIPLCLISLQRPYSGRR